MKILFILSGGLDSTTALYDLQREHDVVEAVTFDYGQRHGKEITCAVQICEALNLPHRVIDMRNLNELLQGSSLTSPNIATPHGHYEQENMKQTIVPNRNAIFLNIAAGYAISKKIHGLGLGVHAGDHFIYPDCRPDFIEAQQKTLSLANDVDFHLFTPFLNVNKTEIVAKGHILEVPFDRTWTCYEGGAKPCNQCGSCMERIEAFVKNSLADPLYDPVEWQKLVKNM
jgi:7-cyano-7-deazaguanine synthase